MAYRGRAVPRLPARGAEDALYNAFGRAVRQDRTGAAGNDVGRKSMVFNAYLTDRQDIFVQYAHFFPGGSSGQPDPASRERPFTCSTAWRW